MKNQRSYTVLLAEDNPIDRDILINFIERKTELNLLSVIENGKEALEQAQEEYFDLLILDVNMPDLSGVEVVQNLDKDEMPYIIFSTALAEYALQAFEFGAVDYILKPFAYERFEKAIEKFLDTIAGKETRTEESQPQKFVFTEDGKHFSIPFNDIIYFSSNGKRSIVHSIDRDYETPLLLKDIHGKLPDDRFQRIHKKHILNIKFSSGLKYEKSGYYTVFLNDEDETSLPVGRHSVDPLKEYLGIS